MKYLKKLAIILMTLPFMGIAQNNEISDLKILDSNQDGIINPYEALDVILLIQKESKGDLRLKDLKKTLNEYEKDSKDELNDIMKELDANKNGVIEFSEVDDKEFMMYLSMMDVDKSESVTKTELYNFNFEDAFFLNDKELKKEIKNIFNEYTKSEIIDLNKLNDTIRVYFEEWDLNRDGQVNKTEAFDYMKPNNMPVSFEIKANVAYMKGVICASTPAKVLELMFEYPNVKTIEMIHVPGSIDDVSNLRASLYVHQFGLNTHLNDRSIIASGGTDFFLAGKERTVMQGAKIGVHSWGGGTKPATELSKNNKAHKKYIDYYKIVNIPTDFYWYTLEAAPANDIHFMTEEEIKKYKVRTKL